MDFSGFTLEDRKFLIIRQMFLNRADEDYLTARWCFCSGAFHNFLWNGAQAMEKYMKTALLLSGQHAKRGHAIPELYKLVNETDGFLKPPSTIVLPDATPQGSLVWQGQPFEEFINYMQWYGRPGNRYNELGFAIEQPLLHCLDAFCCWQRKLIAKINFCGRRLVEYSIGHSDQDWPLEREDWMIGPDYLLERAQVSKFRIGEDEILTKTFETANHAFFKDVDVRQVFSGSSFQGNLLVHHLIRIRHEDPSERNQEIVEQLAAWCDENLKISASQRSFLEENGVVWPIKKGSQIN